MADVLTKEQRRKNMQHIRSKDTSIEVKLRTALWHEGIRYRKNCKVLPGKPDITITKHKIVVFCDSSFFHGKDFATKKPVAENHAFWNKKIRQNIEHDNDVNKQLQVMGWKVLRFWDVDINKHLNECVQAVKEAVFERKTAEK